MVLTGSGVDSDGSITSYQWTQNSGTAVELLNSDNATVSCTAPGADANQPLVFELIVTDNDGATATDLIDVYVVDPVQSAGADKRVTAQSKVYLDATADPAQGAALQYLWQQTGGVNVTLLGSDKADATYVAPATSGEELSTFTLTITYENGAVHSDEVVITAVDASKMPIDDILFGSGDLSTCVNYTARLNGWTYVSELTNLLCESPYKMSGFVGIENLTALRELELGYTGKQSNTNISDKDSHRLSNLTALNRLLLKAGDYYDLTFLQHLTSLTELHLSTLASNRDLPADLSVLVNLQALTKLSLVEWAMYEGVSDISVLTQLPELTSLFFNFSSFSDYSILAGVKKLKRLSVPEGVPNLTQLEQFPALEELHIWNAHNVDFSPLVNIKTLRSLTVGNTT
ncbi:MAG: hypothetical protein MJK04_28730, partial [Psychrosphaera sp.]|nr:hypothetical protein [Psychrosphaera sp.]